MADTQFSILGHSVAVPTGKLETFPNPGVDEVKLDCLEVTALCPVTGQPDVYVVNIGYVPRTLCVESKSLKLYLWTLRNEGHFCEALAVKIRNDLWKALDPESIEVFVTQSPRGGISIRARSEAHRVKHSHSIVPGETK